MPKGIIFNIFVKGKGRASRLAFQTIKKDGVITFCIWDRCFGIFVFKVLKKKDDEHTIIPLTNCIAKNTGNWCSKSFNDADKCCVNSFCDCKDKRIQIAYIILTCLQEYLIRKEEAKIARTLAKQNNTSEGNTSIKRVGSKSFSPATTKPFRIDGAITVHNYDIKPHVTGKFSGRGHTGVQKCPHIRTGYWRTYKNGKKVYVKSCIVHKEDYKGYTSADQI